jgi:hypothetical protein
VVQLLFAVKLRENSPICAAQSSHSAGRRAELGGALGLGNGGLHSLLTQHFSDLGALGDIGLSKVGIQPIPTASIPCEKIDERAVQISAILPFSGRARS